MIAEPDRTISTPARRNAVEIAWYAAAFLAVVALGVLNLPFPFVSDQVVSLIGARTISAGGTLYVDFWDNKLPGLVWFHFLAGELFGYTEIGLHTLDLIWMTVFAAVLAVTLRGYYTHPWLSAGAMLAVVGMYYASVESFQLTQLEILVGLPAFLAAWFASRLPAQPRSLALAFAASGVLAGITVTFKIVFAPLFPAFWLIASLHLLISRQRSTTELLRLVWLPAAAGTAAVLALVALKFWRDGALSELLWTAFVYPPQALAMSATAPWWRLTDGVLYFTSYYAPWSVFIVFAALHWWRAERDPLTGMLLAWLAIGIVLILIQRFSWWTYHFLFLFPPAGILGLRGVDVAARMVLGETAPDTRAARRLTAVVAFAALAALAVPATQKVGAYVEVMFRKAGSLRDFQHAISRDYARIHHSTRFLVDAGARKGRIYVFGDPLYYHLSGRKPALPIIGWPWEYFLQSQWLRLPEQLGKARPPYLYVDKTSVRMMEIRGGGVSEFIERHYTSLFADATGTWYGAKTKSWDD